jgi:hypothetical protein
MIKIKIMNEFLHSPIWTYVDDFICEDLDIISDDETIQMLCDKIENMFSGYYEFDSHDVPCWFNEEQQKADKEEMLSLVKQLKTRLEEINDGSYEIEDLITPFYEEL